MQLPPLSRHCRLVPPPPPPCVAATAPAFSIPSTNLPLQLPHLLLLPELTLPTFFHESSPDGHPQPLSLRRDLAFPLLPDSRISIPPSPPPDTLLASIQRPPIIPISQPIVPVHPTILRAQATSGRPPSTLDSVLFSLSPAPGRPHSPCHSFLSRHPGRPLPHILPISLPSLPAKFNLSTCRIPTAAFAEF